MNLLSIAINGNTFGILLLSILTALVMGITLFRFFLHRKTHQDLTKNGNKEPKTLSERNKYLPVNVFRYSGTFFNIGLVIALGVTLLAFNWTKFEDPVKISIVWDNPDDNEMQVIRTAAPEPPKLPPPPKQPKFEIAEVDIEADTVTFVDQSLTNFKRPEPSAPPKPKSIVLPPPVEKEDKAPPIFKVVEEMPRFPGCEDMAADKTEKKNCADRKLLQFISQNIKYPAIARENRIQGRCFITFVVEKDGSVTNVELARDIGGQCGKEALRVVNLMARSDLKWSPGKQRGKPVRVQFSLPIHFQLD